MPKLFLLVLVLNAAIIINADHNKYTKESNLRPGEAYDFRPTNLKHLDRPFRMAKLNLLWNKAIVRLTEPKLKSLFGELKIHDKEELTWKHLRAEGKDKDGLKEAELRKKLSTIMSDYGLMDTFDDVHDDNKNQAHKPLNEATYEKHSKPIFKDKKLNKLWQKAEMAGFTAEELSALKEEFSHHQDKVDQYFQLLADVRTNEVNHDENSVDDKLDKFNEIEFREEGEPKKDYLDKINLLRDNHREIKEHFDHLSLLAESGPASREFVEPRVNRLWRIALESNFSSSELESLKVELRHYENRLLKFRHVQAEHALNEEERKKKIPPGEKHFVYSTVEESLKKQARKIDKIHLELESRIMQKHQEL